MLRPTLYFLTLAAIGLAPAATADAPIDRRVQQQIRAAGPAQAPQAEATTEPAVDIEKLEAVLAGAEIVAPPKPAASTEPVTVAARPLPAAPRRSLAPPSTPSAEDSPGGSAQPLSFDWNSLPFNPTSTAAALAMVVGLLLLCLAAVRKAGPKSQRVLPGEVAAVLGRVPLGGKQTAHLLKLGSKLVLVHISPEEVKTITEVTDPAEVTRLLGLCEQNADHSSSTAFRDVFARLAEEPAGPGFLGDASTLIDRQKLADAYAATPGGRHG